MRVTWVQPEDLVRHELWQSAAEGRDVSTVRDRWAVAGGIVEPPHGGKSPDPAPPALRELAVELLDDLAALPDVGADREPSAWTDIRAVIEPASTTPVDRDGLHERLVGGWLGRAVGCLLGKPVEKIAREGIEEILRSTGRWPLDRYFTAVGLDPAVSERWPWNRASRPTSLEENIDGMPEDDDLNYTLLALRIIEEHGAAFTADDVAQAWLLDLPAGRVFTAERAAYRNLLDGISPPESATVRNPYREWIGAQIRTDLYGWVNPGQPAVAAEWAWRDASVSHTRNGMYGAMFVAAMASAATCADDIDTVLDAGASVVPPQSRMAEAIALGRRLGASGVEPTEAYAQLEQAYAGMHWVHALNNSALVAYALTAGAGRFDRSICLAVMGGWDTDSNGATVGAVAGALGGPTQIAEHWTAPLKDRLASSIPGTDGSSFAELADRTNACASVLASGVS